MILLTAELIEALMTPKGGYNKAALDHLGVGWPPVTGWKARLIGSQIANAKYAAALKAKDQTRHCSWRKMETCLAFMSFGLIPSPGSGPRL